MKLPVTFLFLLASITALAQPGTSTSKLPLKIKHAEPLYIDLMRDMGARKGEREWNIGGEIAARENCIAHSGFIEYEFSPINRLGLEIELPFTFYSQQVQNESQAEPVYRSRVEGIKIAGQYTFMVSGKRQLSLAVAYVHEFGFHSFYTISTKSILMKGNTFNPVFIAAKKWGKQFHSLVYAGPAWNKPLDSRKVSHSCQVNTSIHYMLPGSSHFIGLEVNQEHSRSLNEVVLRPQAKVAISNAIALGLVTGIPLNLRQGISFMMRLIIEPASKK